MDKVCAFQQKIVKWNNKLENKLYDMFPSFSEAIENADISDIQLNAITCTVKKHLPRYLA